MADNFVYVEGSQDKSLLAFMKQYGGKGEYKVGDTIESVAWREGQLHLIRACENMMKKGRTTLNN